MRPKLSLAMIVKNAQATLERCLTDCKAVVDEMVIVDTGSTDGSIEIAKKFTDKVYHFDWIDDFSAARNYAFSKCSYPWILWMDSDDYILPEDQKKINELEFPADRDIIICQYQYAHDEFGVSISTVPRERIINHGKLQKKWEEEIHETYPIVGASLWVTDISTHHNKQHGTSERNLAILERIVQKKDNARNTYYLAKEYFDFGRTDDAILWLTKYVERPQRDWFWEDYYTAHYLLAQCYMNKNDDAKFKYHIFESLKIEERRAEPLYLLGWYYHLKNQWDKAIQWYEASLAVRRPLDLLSGHRPEFYTWLPRLQLCVCYNAIGDLKKAYEYNKQVLSYRPQDSRAVANERVLGSAIVRKAQESRKDGEGKRLNLGCGGKTMEGYTNVDLFKGKGVDEVFEMDEIPYKDGTISGIYSEHSLEHVPFARAEKSLREWHRVLRPGGELSLYMPDFERCCQAYLHAPILHDEFMKTKMWFKNTIYGIQKSQAGEPDEAQIHKCGFSKEEIQQLLERVGFIVDYCDNYGGPGQKFDYGTPSYGIRALKPASSLRVGWISAVNWEAAQTRIRVLHLNRWFKARGYYSAIVNYPEITSQNFDVAIVGKSFDESHFTNIKWLKRYGKIVYCDLCEDIIGWPWVNEILSICDKVICCSDALADKVRPINPKVVVIEDAWEA